MTLYEDGNCTNPVLWHSSSLCSSYLSAQSMRDTEGSCDCTDKLPACFARDD